MVHSKYPTMEEVEKAEKHRLAFWYRFLSSPGSLYIGENNFEEMLKEEHKILLRIIERFNALGGFTPELSKTWFHSL